MNTSSIAILVNDTIAQLTLKSFVGEAPVEKGDASVKREGADRTRGCHCRSSRISVF